MVRTKITDQLVAEFVRLDQRHQSYRSIGGQFGVDWRTVKVRIQKAKGERDQQHWEAVSLQIDAKFMEEHYAMLRQMALSVLKAVSSQPLFSPPGQLAGPLLKNFTNFEASESTFAMLKLRGVDFLLAPSTEIPDSIGDPVSERFPRILRQSLFEHEPALERLVRQWESLWDLFQRARTELASEAIRLFENPKHRVTPSEEIGSGLAHQVMARDLMKLLPDYPLFHEGKNGQYSVQFRPGAPDGTTFMVDSGQCENSLLESFEFVQCQISHESRMTPVSELYGRLVIVVGELESCVDQIILKGRPDGRCSTLCPNAQSSVL
jgi:hypothetical protein